jgi:thiamine-phosphate pyrophosphorylase
MNKSMEGFPDWAYRVVDANINRAMEGLRVVEEFLRFGLNNEEQSLKIAQIRHGLPEIINHSPVDKSRMLKARNIKGDVGKERKDSGRVDISDILIANFRRIEEALRVLEEFMKIIDLETSNKIREQRFLVYDLEKEMSDFF